MGVLKLSTLPGAPPTTQQHGLDISLVVIIIKDIIKQHMKLVLQRKELEAIRDVIDSYLETEDKFDYKEKQQIINTNIGVAITDRETRETLLFNIKRLNCLGKVLLTVNNNYKDIDEDEIEKGYREDIKEMGLVKDPKAPGE